MQCTLVIIIVYFPVEFLVSIFSCCIRSVYTFYILCCFVLVIKIDKKRLMVKNAENTVLMFFKDRVGRAESLCSVSVPTSSLTCMDDSCSGIVEWVHDPPALESVTRPHSTYCSHLTSVSEFNLNMKISRKLFR